MKKETKNEVKKHAATGASTAAGAAAGVVIGAALNPEEAHAEEIDEVEVEAQPAPRTAHQHASHQPASNQPASNEPAYQEPVSQEPESKEPENPGQQESQNPGQQEPQEPQQPVTPEGPTNGGLPEEVEVIEYERVSDEDGSQMDVAVVNVNGTEVGILDFDLDGEADAIMCDANQNGEIEDGEIEIVQGEGISMQPFQDAAGFNPLFAQNDLPDYVNDADVDTYMA